MVSVIKIGYNETCKLVKDKSHKITADGDGRKGMPVYEYEHLKKPCTWGSVFEYEQSIRDRPLENCPHCGGSVKKLISRIHISCPKSNSELRDLGFTKLVRRDDGVYENVTARDKDSRYMVRGKPDSVPDLSKTIKD
jgi:putative FmdB family regulatory protein